MICQLDSSNFSRDVCDAKRTLAYFPNVQSGAGSKVQQKHRKHKTVTP
uniref:Uncharacterized protein n=1 Tax=Anguilla anguilla TaxID=7936 RepID=A0A0E9UAH9_ANGAN